VSIAWALLDPSVNRDIDARRQPGTYEGAISAEGISDNSSSGIGDNGESNKEPQVERFPCIPCFPSELIPTLHQRFGARVSSEHVGGFDVDTVAVKIGKDIFSWPLRGSHVH